ncbi:MAG: RNA methyltransferase, partial [Clostridiales bacterium]|nr:RNA methyltransferase [Clostridiales bacterium]
PTVRAAIPFDTLLQEVRGFGTVIFPYEKAKEPSLRAFLRELSGNVPNRVAVIVGSEGGFAEEEVAALQACGVTPVTLGKRILRAETANISVVSALMYEWGQWE